MERNLKETSYEFWQRIGSPKHVCAPMVDQSELSFRILAGRHGCDLVYSPMYNGKMMVTNKTYLKDVIYDHRKAEKPTFTQLCGSDPEILLQVHS